MTGQQHIYIYIKEYCSAIKNNGIMPFAVIWMGLEIIILSEVTQRKTITIAITYMRNLKQSYKINYFKKKKTKNPEVRRSNQAKKGVRGLLEAGSP